MLERVSSTIWAIGFGSRHDFVITWLLSLVSKQTQNIDAKTKTLNVITLRRWQGGLGGPARPVMPIAHRQRAQALLPPWILWIQITTRLPHHYHVVCSIRLWGMCKAFRRGIAWRMRPLYRQKQLPNLGSKSRRIFSLRLGDITNWWLTNSWMSHKKHYSMSIKP